MKLTSLHLSSRTFCGFIMKIDYYSVHCMYSTISTMYMYPMYPKENIYGFIEHTYITFLRCAVCIVYHAKYNRSNPRLNSEKWISEATRNTLNFKYGHTGEEVRFVFGVSQIKNVELLEYLINIYSFPSLVWKIFVQLSHPINKKEQFQLNFLLIFFLKRNLGLNSKKERNEVKCRIGPLLIENKKRHFVCRIWGLLKVGLCGKLLVFVHAKLFYITTYEGGLLSP